MHQVTQRDTGLQLALEAHQHAFRHVQRHHAGGGAEGHQTRTCREADADREARVAVAAGTHGVGQQQTVEPRVDDAVTRTQRHATAVADEGRQLAVRLHVHRLGIGSGVTERLHHHVGREAQAGQILQLVAGHGASGVLAAHGRHARLAVGARTDALPLGQATGTTDHLLRQREALAGIDRCLGQAERGGRRQAQGLAGLGRERAADDQVDAAASLHLVQQHLALQGEVGNLLAVLLDAALVGEDVEHIAHLHLRDVHLDGQRPGVFLRVEEDGGDLAAQRDTAEALVGHVGDVLASGPDHAVGGRLAAGAGTHHVTHVGHQVPLLLQVLDELDGAALAVFLGLEGRVGAGVLQHGQVVQRDVRTAPGIGRGREVVGVGLAGHLEDRDGDLLGHLGTAGEPFGVCPALHHFLGLGIACLGLGGHVVEEVEHQQRLLQGVGGHTGHLGIVQQLDQRVDVVAPDHRAQQLGGLGSGDQPDLDVTMGDGSQEAGLDLGGIVHPRRHPVGEQIHQEFFFAGRRILDQLDQLGGLFGIQCQGRNAQRRALGNMLAILIQHGLLLRPSSIRNGYMGTIPRKPRHHAPPCPGTESAPPAATAVRPVDGTGAHDGPVQQEIALARPDRSRHPPEARMARRAPCPGLSGRLRPASGAPEAWTSLQPCYFCKC